MKLKDLELPCFCETTETYGSPFVWATEIVEVQSWRTYRKPTKKVVTLSCKLSADGSCVQVDDCGWVDKKTPGQLRCMVTKEQVLDRLQGTRASNEAKDFDQRLYNTHVDKLIDALTAAGFPGFYDGCRGLDMSKSRVVQWIKDNGHVLPPTTEEV